MFDRTKAEGKDRNNLFARLTEGGRQRCRREWKRNRGKKRGGVDFSAGLQLWACALKYLSPEARWRFLLRGTGDEPRVHIGSEKDASSVLAPPFLPPSTSGQPVTSQCPDNSLFSNAVWKERHCWQQVAERGEKTSGRQLDRVSKTREQERKGRGTWVELTPLCSR